MIFHYDFNGAPTEVFFLPQVTQKLGPGQIKSHRVFTTDAAGNDAALITIPLPVFTTSPNPVAAALLNWRLQCIANDAEPLILTTPESTASSSQFTLCPDLEARGIGLQQQVRSRLVHIPHSIFTPELPWLAIPRVTMQTTSRQSTHGEGSFEAL